MIIAISAGHPTGTVHIPVSVIIIMINNDIMNGINSSSSSSSILDRGAGDE